jgi:hypothetical protein
MSAAVARIAAASPAREVVSTSSASPSWPRSRPLATRVDSTTRPSGMTRRVTSRLGLPAASLDGSQMGTRSA